MPDEKGNLYLFEAIELRKEYDRRIKLLEQLLGGGKANRTVCSTGATKKRENQARTSI
jgi:hypothetical protein